MPSWIPFPILWTYLVGAGFIAAALGIAAGILTRVAASAVAATFLVFVIAMDAPAWLDDLANRNALTLALRELAFCGGALALVSGRMRTIARYFIAVPVVVYSVEQALHGDHVPGVPLKMMTPTYLPVHALWTYLTAAVYAVAGALLLAGRNQRVATFAIGATVLVLVLVVYVPIAVVENGSLSSFNFVADTLMFGGAVLLLGRADRQSPSTMPR